MAFNIYDVLDYNWGLMAPELVILLTATVLSVWDMCLGEQRDKRFLGWFALLGVLTSIAFVMAGLNGPVQEILGDKYRSDAFANAFKLIILLAACFSLVQAVDDVGRKKLIDHGEFYYLFLAATLGAMIMVSSADLVTIYIGLETLSIASYIMAGMRKRDAKSNEGAFKYIVYGGAASATMLYGFSFIYGLTGSTHLYTIAERLYTAYEEGFSFIILMAFLLMLVGFGFKASIAPFHMWAPDVYEGSPVPFAAYLSVASKTAGFAAMLKVFFIAFGGGLPDAGAGWFLQIVSWTLAIVAALSMIAGNTIALWQTNAKRLMAYSSIGQAGYLLVPFAVLNAQMFDQMLFFLVAYLLMNMGLFTVIQVVSQDRGTEDLAAFAGLSRRSPWLAIATTLLLISLAGFPISAGFFGKFNIFMGALDAGNYWLPAVMLVTTVISYTFYFELARQMFLRESFVSEGPLLIPFSLRVVIVVTVLGTLLFGIMPGLLMESTHNFFPVMEELIQQAAPALR